MKKCCGACRHWRMIEDDPEDREGGYCLWDAGRVTSVPFWYRTGRALRACETLASQGTRCKVFERARGN